MLSRIEQLPVECILDVLRYLSDVDLLRLQRTSSALCEIVRSDTVWFNRCRRLFLAYAASKAMEHRLLALEAYQGWYGIWNNFLGPHERFLGFWASQLPYHGRLIRCSIVLDEPGVDLPLIDRLLLRFEGISPENIASIEDAIALAPPTAAIQDDRGPTFFLPMSNASPDRGLSVDVLKIAWQLSPFFTVSHSHGAILHSDSTVRGSSNCAVDLSYDAAWITELDLERSRHGVRASEILTSDLISFPTYQVFRSSFLRNGKLTSVDGKMCLSSPSMHWSPQVAKDGVSTPSTDRESLPHVEREGPRFIYQTPPQLNRRIQPPTTLQILRNPNAYHLPLLFQIGHHGTTVQTLGQAIRARRIEGETYFPVQSSTPFRYVAKGTEYPAEWLTGIWSGSFGPHGLEMGYVHVREAPARIYHADEVDLADIEFDHPFTRPTVLERGSSTDFRKIIEYIKVTGDDNVPAGEDSWAAWMPNSDNATLPTVTSEQLRDWWHANPSMRSVLQPIYEQSSLEARGHIAFQGFLEPRYSKAEATFVRSTHPEDSDLETVIEIRLRWIELGKVAVFMKMPPYLEASS